MYAPLERVGEGWVVQERGGPPNLLLITAQAASEVQPVSTVRPVSLIKIIPVLGRPLPVSGVCD